MDRHPPVVMTIGIRKQVGDEIERDQVRNELERHPLSGRCSSAQDHFEFFSALELQEVIKQVCVFNLRRNQNILLEVNIPIL